MATEKLMHELQAAEGIFWRLGQIFFDCGFIFPEQWAIIGQWLFDHPRNEQGPREKFGPVAMNDVRTTSELLVPFYDEIRSGMSDDVVTAVAQGLTALAEQLLNQRPRTE